MTIVALTWPCPWIDASARTLTRTGLCIPFGLQFFPPRILSFGPPRRVPNPEGRRRLRCRDPNEGEELCDQGRYHNSEMIGMWSEGWTSGRRLLLGERCVAAWRLLGWGLRRLSLHLDEELENTGILGASTLLSAMPSVIKLH
jgi:hypothetical protein